MRDVNEDFFNILILEDYTLLVFMAFWCTSCFIYFLIWDFVFEFYIQSQNISFIWSLWRCLHAKRFQWSVSPYRTTVSRPPPVLPSPRPPSPRPPVLSWSLFWLPCTRSCCSSESLGWSSSHHNKTLWSITTGCQVFYTHHHTPKSRKVRPKQIEWCRSWTARTRSVVKIWHNLVSFLLPFLILNHCGT